MRCPSAFVTIVGFPPSIAATAEFVVPRSIPTTFSLTTLTGPTPEVRRREPELLRSRKKADLGVPKEAVLGDNFCPKKIEFGREEEGFEVDDVKGVAPRTWI